MRIAIDARAYGWAGVGRYTRNLLLHLAQIDSDNKYIVLLGQADVKQFKGDIKDAPYAHLFSHQVVNASYYSWQEQTIFLRQLARVRADLFHFTHFNVPLFFRRPYVVTIHDITRFIFPGQTQQSLFKQLAYEQVFRHAVESSRGIICVSETTRSDISDLPIRLPGVVKVIHEAVDQSFLQPIDVLHKQRVRMMVGTSDPYLLYVGVWMGHKNLPRLLQAYAQVLERYPYLKLVLTGKPRPGYVGVDKVARLLGLDSSRVVYLGFVSADLLPALYAQALCLVYPSLYEGFGLPGLEALACGTPVVASNVSSLPEVLGARTEFVNPEYVPGIAAGITRILADSDYRSSIVAKGLDRASQFSWKRAARETLAVYEAV